MHHPSGQGLLETVVALGIISVGLVAAIALTTSSFAASREGVGRLVATNFAREGVEVVRNARDTAVMNRTVLETVLGPVPSDHTAVPVFDAAENAWSLDFSVEKILDAGAVIPGYASNARLLTINPICRDLTTEKERVDDVASCAAGETRIGYQVISLVQWTSGINTRTVQAETWLYDWQ